MYPGPQRPRTETALISADDAEVQNIDGMALPVGSKFIVLPGEHSMAAKSSGPPDAPIAATTICFEAQPGRMYVVEAGDWANRWQPRIRDGATASPIRTRLAAPNGTCAGEPTPARPRRMATPIVAAQATEAAPPVDHQSTDEGDAPAPAVLHAAVPAADGEVPGDERPSPPPPPVGAAPRAVPARDDDAPRFVRPHGAARYGDQTRQPDWVRHPGNGLMFELGAFFGGEDLVTAQLSDGSTETLSAGQGVGFTLGGMWTPLWVGDGAGFGLGAYAGWKYDSIGGSNATVSLSRFPVGATVHTLLRLDDRWLLLLRGGIQKELDVSVSGSGDANALNGTLTGELGGLGEGGIYYIFASGEGHAAMSFTIRYTAIHDSVGGVSVPASNLGFAWSMYYDL